MNYFTTLVFFALAVTSSSYFVVNLWNFLKFFCGCSYLTSTQQSLNEIDEDPLNSILTDLGLILLFIGQHKLMSILSAVLEGTSIQPATRSLYVLSTGVVLQIILKYWLPTPGHIVWNLTNVLPSPLLWTLPVLQGFLLLLALIQVLMADLPLLLGIKQMWFSVHNRGDPSLYKSHGLRRYLTHVPHPVLAPILALWCRNIMSVDMFILVCGLSACASQLKTDEADIAYVKRQFYNAYLY